MKKRIVAIVMASAFAMAMTACGGAGSSAASSAADAASSAASAASSAVSEAASSAADAASSAASAASSTAEASVSTEEASEPEAGFEEIPIFEDEEAGFLSVNAVYFQPVPMSDGTTAEGYDMHIEADVAAMENTLGYGVGDWVPYLTVDYKITGSDGNVDAEGTFMTMAASDGPHYGANIKLPEADTYSVDFTFHSPEENGYLLHTDAETGPGGSFDDYWADGNLTVHYEGWDYTPQEW